MDHESAAVLHFSPLQGETARKALKSSSLPEDIGEKTIILWDGERFFIRSRAAVRIMDIMGGKWKRYANILRVVPTPISDLGYRFIASIRRHIPINTNCSIPTPQQRARFLD